MTLKPPETSIFDVPISEAALPTSLRKFWCKNQQSLEKMIARLLPLFAVVVCVLPVVSGLRVAITMGTGVPSSLVGVGVASRKLYQDQHSAQARRAKIESDLLLPFVELQETKVKPFNNVESGTGFKQVASKSLYAKELGTLLVYIFICSLYPYT
jgi:hypothetical protein